MKEQDLLDATIKSFPNFNEARHNVLCSELKQLYVAITRTRQRLWICEDVEEFSKPMFEYWKKRGLVQVKQLDNSLAQAMQVASSPEEWKARGIKVCFIGFYYFNFIIAVIIVIMIIIIIITTHKILVVFVSRFIMPLILAHPLFYESCHDFSYKYYLCMFFSFFMSITI